MSEQENDELENLSEQEQAIAELVADAQASTVADNADNGKNVEASDGGENASAPNADGTVAVNTDSEKPTKQKIFQKYKIRDIVFLAIITACTLVTGAVMPFVSGVPLFGIIQLCLGLQFSIFPVIGMMKVRKPFALLLQSIFISIFLVFMFPPMVSIIICALIAEGLTLLIFRGYKSDWACVFAGTLYMPLTIPMLFAVYAIMPQVGKGNAAEQMFIIGNENPWIIVGMTVAVVAVCFVGSVVGMLIARELRKSGKLK